MGRSTKHAQKEKMSQKRLDSLITNPDLNKESQINSQVVLFGCEEYDTLHPEEALKTFCSTIRDILSRYEFDKIRLNELENQMQDLLHYIELTENKNANAGYKLYKQLAIVRRERRVCKNEIDLLQPVYEAFHETGLLNRLSELQGKCRTQKQFIDKRGYAVRTDILNEI